MDAVWYEENNKTLPQQSLDALGPLPQAFLVLLYSLTALTALVGNITVIVVLAYAKRCPASLKKLLINLAVADVLTAVFSIPFSYTDFMLGRWVFPNLLCHFALFIQVLSIFVSVYSLTVIAVERYFATIHTFGDVNLFIKTHSGWFVAVGWLLGSILGSIQLFHTEVVQFSFEGVVYDDCRENWDPLASLWFTVVLFLITYACPLTVIGSVYGAIIAQIIRHQPPESSTQLVNKVKVVKMMIALVVLFGLCWLPIHVFILLFTLWPQLSLVLDEESKAAYYLYVGTYFLCHWLAMANSCINPFVYCFMSKPFRNDFFKVFNKLISYLRRGNSSPSSTIILL